MQTTISRSKQHLLLALTLLAPLFVAERANAQQACGDIVCPDGYTCESASAPCADVACAPGETCVAAPCEPKTYHYCAPSACTTDSDCGEGMVCFEHVSKRCAETAPSTEPCPPDAECAAFAPAPPVDCTPVTERLCTPRYLLPCQADADCGAGFRCQEQESCGSSGSGPTPPEPTPLPGSSDGGADDSGSGSSDSDSGSGDASEPRELPAPPTVTCEPSGVFSCVAIETACNADADCVSGWSCRDNPEGVCWAGPNGEHGCTPADPPRLCMPPYSTVPTGAPRGEDTNEGGYETPGSTPVPPATPDPQPTPSPESADDLLGGRTEGGCAMTPARSGSSGLAFIMLSLASALAFRRRR